MKQQVTFIRELTEDWQGAACLVQRGKEYFVVSSVTAFDTGRFETLAFLATAEGVVTSFNEVAGGRGKSREDTMTELESSSEPRPEWE